MAVHIVHHADSDGRFGAWCAWRHFKDQGIEATLYSAQYQETPKLIPEHLTRDDSVFIIDFSYPVPILQRYAKHAGSIVVLDHHKSAQKQLEGVGALLDVECKSYIKFDMSKSGALLAWEHFFPGVEPIKACHLIDDRDLWQYKYGDESRALESLIRAEGDVNNIEWWDKLARDKDYFDHALATGLVYLRYEQLVVNKFISSRRNYEIVTVDFKGQKLKCCLYEGMGILHSELAEAFYTSPKHDLDFTMEWRRKAQDRMVFSLRSNKIDVSELAVTMSGGGHAAAAGFSSDLQLGLHLVSRMYGGSYIFPFIPEGSILN